MKLHEMTMKVGQMNQEDGFYAKYLTQASSEQSDYDYVGDIEYIKVMQQDDVFLLVIDGNAIAFFQVSVQGELLNAYVSATHRNTGVFTKFIWFLKRTLNYSRIIFGDRHSPDTQEVVKRLHKRFNVYWSNGIATREFDPNNTDEFYSDKAPTGWKIILENDGDFSEWPKSFNLLDSRTHFDWL